MYISPITRAPLKRNLDASGKNGNWVGLSGESFPVKDGVVWFLGDKDLSSAEQEVRGFYDARAEAYDQFLHLTFFTHNENETSVREGMINLLKLAEDSKVLEIASGTGRDSELIASRLGQSGELYVTDIAPQMMKRCVERLQSLRGPQVEYALCGASCLPFPTDSFDALYSFGGLGEFPDIPGSLKEMARVVKPGGKIVVGDESMPPWLKGTQFAKILTTTNPQFDASLPLQHLPVEARNVRLQWVIGGVFYLIDFEVGEGEPEGNFDFEIPGPRGGTYRTRYEGRLEGVTPEAKELYQRAANASGKSLHQWLDDVVKKAAKNDLDLK